RALRVRVAGRALDARVVGAEAVLALLAVDQRIGKTGDVPRGLPHLGMHQDGRVEALDVLARVYHRAPPALLDVLLQLYPERPIEHQGALVALDGTRARGHRGPRRGPLDRKGTR